MSQVQPVSRAPGVIRDEIPGGFVQENFGHKPETFYSWSSMRQRADALGLMPFVRQLESGKETAYIDAKTMDNARVLLTRGARPRTATEIRCETLETQVRELKSIPA